MQKRATLLTNMFLTISEFPCYVFTTDSFTLLFASFRENPSGKILN